uniref:Uncharacterized protein n=1 Tax=Branchiostoma floridae TaxID=7739 RepID=C3YW56_BRAFL|eukprot:XP_002599498.1 hypothetical protein BRAFLDRAFT_80991 [Branchiostoma floridae]
MRNDGSSSHSLPFLRQIPRNYNRKRANYPHIVRINCEDSEVETDNDSLENPNEMKSYSLSSEHFGGTGQGGGTSTAETVEAQGGGSQGIEPVVVRVGMASPNSLTQAAEDVNGVTEAAVLGEQTEEKVDEAVKEEKKDEAPAEEPEKIEVAVENPAETDDAKAAAADVVPDDKPVENEEKADGDASQEAN